MDTKALRQKVLDLAIRGKLVPQDPNDEPASVLLERIRQQKQQMVKDGKLKAKDIKNDTVIFVGEDNLHYEKFADGSVKCIEDEIPFDLPEGWAWSRLGSLIELFITGPFGSALHKSDYVADGIPLINPMNIIDGKIVPIDKMQVSPETVERLSSFKVAPNDIVIARRGDMGRCAVVRPEQEGWLCGTGSFVLRIPSALCSEYFAVCLRSPYSVEYLSGNSIGNTMLNLNQAILKSILLPVPPCTEQNRIINAILDSDIHLTEITKQREALVIYVAKAKAKILGLAIRGQLVPQDPTDEPASVLLERIRAEKEELIRQGKIKRDKKESVIFRGEDNSYYLRTGDLVEPLEDWAFEELPDNWAVCCLGELCDYGNCTNIDTTDIADSAWMLDLEDIEKDSGVVLQKVRKAGRNAASTKHRFHKGQVLYSKLRPYLNKVVLADEDGYCTSEILPLEFERNILPQYARYYLMSPAFLRYANKCSYGVKMPRLGTADGKKAIISVPPFEEQRRIVIAIEQAFSQLASITENLS